MDFALDDDQRMMREMAERICRGELEPRLAAHPADAPMSRALLLELFAAVRDAGLLAPRLPEADGGAGLRAAARLGAGRRRIHAGPGE